MKRFLSLFLTLLIIISSVPMTAQPVSAASSGTCGENLTWSLDVTTGVLTISGTGEMKDYDYDINYYVAPWYTSNSYIKTVIIEEGVTSIGNYAFYGCDSITSIMIPDSVSSIGDCAFEDCFSLTSITIPDSVSSIGSSVFSGCTSITSITIPDGVINIGGYAFYNCSSLKSVSIPDSVTSIGEYTFYNCSALESVSIPDGVTNIGDYTFYNCSALESVNIPESVTSIGEYTFYNCSVLESVNIPEGVTSIGEYAFCTCSALESINIPDSVTSIGECAFYGCSSLASITISAGVISIGDSAFRYCRALGTAEYKGTLKQWASISMGTNNGPLEAAIKYKTGSCGTSVRYAYDLSEGTLVIVGTGPMDDYTSTSKFWDNLRSNIKSIIIDKGVTRIGNYAFYNFTALTSIELPDTLTSVGKYAVKGCNSLKSIIYKGTPQQWKNISVNTYNTELTSVFGACGTDLFWTLDNKTGILVISGTGAMNNYTSSSVPGWYSSRSSIKSVIIEEGVTSIGSYAFNGCSSLISITLPNSVTSIGEKAFNNCSSFKAVHITDMDAWCSISFGTSDSNPLYYAKNLYLNGELVTDLVIPDDVTSIGSYAFYNCSSIERIAIPDSVISIGEDAFSNTAYYKDSNNWEDDALYISNHLIKIKPTISGEFIIREGTKYISGYAFFDCSSLESITIPDSVTSIGSYAFYGCASLTSVTYKGTVEQWDSISIGSNNESLTSLIGSCGTGLFWTLDKKTGILVISGTGAMNDYTSSSNPGWYSSRSSIKSVIIEEGVTNIGHYAFYNCLSLTSVVIGDDVTSIGNDAFYNCTALTSISIPDGVTSIGHSAFYNTAYYNESNNWENKVLYISNHLIKANTSISGDYSIRKETKCIADYAFRDCNSLTSITISDSITSIGDYAFYGCVALSTADYKGTLEQWANVLVGSYNTSLTDLIKYKIGSCGTNVRYAFDPSNGVLLILGTGAMRDYYSAPWYDYRSSIKSVIIEEGVTSIGESAFYYCSSLESITIPDSVTSIGDEAFSYCTSLNAVYITDIAAWCNIDFAYGDSNPLYYANNLYINGELVTELEIPEGATNIKDNAFYNCTSLTSITIPATLTSIGNSAFNGCSSLTSISIPDSVTSIGSYAFDGCNSLSAAEYKGTLEQWANISIGSYNTSFTNLIKYKAGSCGTNVKYTLDTSVGILTISGTGAMKDYSYYSSAPWYSSRSNIKSVTIKEGVTSIGSYAFYNCTSLESITIPDSVTSIGDCVFRGCSSLTSVEIGDGVTRIESYAFRNCTSLTSITIPDSVTSIGSYAFEYCTSLNEVHITDIAAWCNIAFYNDASNPLSYAENLYLNGELVTDLVIPDSVTSIGSYAFYDCDSLTSVDIGDSVTSIGSSAFYDCDSLTSVVIPYSVTSIGSSAFEYCSKLTRAIYLGSKEQWNDISIGSYNYDVTGKIAVCFGSCGENLSWSLDIETDALTISGSGAMGDYASYSSYAPWYNSRSYIKTVIIEEGVTSIGKYVFYNCSSLESITIPDSVTSIGDYAFHGCNTLGTAEYKGTLEQWANISIGSYNTSLTSLIKYKAGSCGTNVKYAFDSSNGVLFILGTGEMYDYFSYSSSPWYNFNSSIKSVIIEDGVTSIGSYAFSGCTSLTSIEIPKDVTSIGDYAFDGCTSLTSVDIGDSVTSIGSYAFYDCDSLTSVDIGDSVTSIGSSAFRGCSSLKSIAIPDSVTSIGWSAFYNCDSLTSITIPDSVSSIGTYAFYSCNSLTSVTIGNGLTSIGDYAFEGCTSLTNAVIPEGVTDIGSYAFGFCESLTNIVIPSSVTNIDYAAFVGCNSLEHVLYIGSESEWTNISNVSSNYELTCSLIHYNATGDEVEALIINEQACTTAGKVAVNCTLCDKLLSTVVTHELPHVFADGVCKLCENNRNDLIESTHYSDLNCDEIKTICKEGAAWIKIAFSSKSKLSSQYEYIYIYDGQNNEIGKYSESELAGKTVGVPGDTAKIRLFSPEGRMSYGYSVISVIPYYEECTHPETETVGAYEPTCLSEGYTGDKFCKECLIQVSSGSSVAPLDHDYQNGVCIRCGTSTFTYRISSGSITITGYSGDEATITIPSEIEGYPVTSIAEKAFYANQIIVNVTIPDSVTSIAKNAFSRCPSLESVTVGNGVESIGNYAFYECESLKDITLGNSLTSIGDGAFMGTAYYNDVDNRTDGVLYIGDYVIKADASLSGEYIIREGTKCIANSAFANCHLLTDVVIPDGVTSIVYATFFDCTSLKSVDVPESVTSIGNSAFRECSSLVSMTIGDSIARIEGYAFYKCSSLNEVHITDIAAWCNIYFYDYYSTPVCYAKRLYLNGELITNLVIPEGVTSIRAHAFEGCSSLESITIPDGVTSIGSYAFEGCSSLESITIPDGVTSIRDHAFEGCSSLESIKIPGGVTYIGISAFNGCFSLRSINIPTAITEINDSVFEGCRSLESITIPDKVIRIWYDAFAGCSSLKNIIVPDSVTEIYKRAFDGCSSLESISFGASVANISNLILGGCWSLKHIEVSENNPYYMNDAEGKVFSKDTMALVIYPSGEAGTSYTVPDSVTTLVYLSFFNCTNLKKVDIPSTVKSISVDAFLDNPVLEEINVIGEGGKYSSINGSLISDGTILFRVPDVTDKEYTVPDGIERIGVYAFWGCNNLETVYISEGVVSISSDAFGDCGSLSKVYMPASVTMIKYGAFPSGIETVYYAGSEEEWNDIDIEYWVWEGHPFKNANIVFNYVDPDIYAETENGVSLDKYKGQGPDVTVPSEHEGKAVVSIGENAFKGNENITSITIPESVTEIAEGAFDGCTSLEMIIYEGEMLPCSVDEAEISEAANEGFSGNGRIEVNYEDTTDETVVFEFTAEKTGSHYVFTDGTSLDAVWVYDENGELLGYTDSLDGSEAKINIDFVKGQTYYVVLRCINLRKGTQAVSYPTKFIINYTSDICGDASNDGKVTIADVLRIRKLIAGVENEDTLSIIASDVNGDGSVSIADVLLIRKLLAGIITEFPAEK